MNNEVKIHGYLCKSEPYNDLELYSKLPKRITFGGFNYWTYSSTDNESCRRVPENVMPELTWEDEPVEVELIMSVKKIGNG